MSVLVQSEFYTSITTKMDEWRCFKRVFALGLPNVNFKAIWHYCTKVFFGEYIRVCSLQDSKSALFLTVCALCFACGCDIVCCDLECLKFFLLSRIIF